MQQTPTWATQLLLQVCKDEGRSKAPDLIWKYNRYGSCGYYSPWKGNKQAGLICIKTKEGDTQEKQVLLHEVSHWLTRPNKWKIVSKRRTWHNKRFYLKLDELLKRYNCWTIEYQNRELRYKSRGARFMSAPKPQQLSLF